MENNYHFNPIAVGLLACAMVFFALSRPSTAESLRIAYTSIAMVYGPLWVTKEAGIFKKHDIDAELLYIAGGPPSLQALIAGDVVISFTAAGAVVAVNLSGSDVVLLGTTIDTLPFELYAIPNIKEPGQLRGTKMGVSRIGATTDFVARFLLKKWGLQPDKDVAIFQAGAGPQVFTDVTREGIQTILGEIASNRPIPHGVTPERFVESRFTKEIVDSGFVDSLYKGR